MLKARMDYGAISAKVLALYGRLLTADDWRRLCDCTSGAEALAFLKTQPGWSSYVSELSASSDIESFKHSIRGRLGDEYKKLSHFLNRDDRQVLELLQSNSDFGYLDVFADIKKNYGGTGKKELVRLLGTQADLLNLVSILRLHRYFPQSLAGAERLLVPISSLLKPGLVEQLLSARSEQEALELLRQSPFAVCFADYKPQELDGLYERTVGSFCRRLIKMPVPNICVPVAYLTLSEIESARLIRIIEALGYGMKPEEL